jgi:ABC-type lipoprotein release transport system permease subunit
MITAMTVAGGLYFSIAFTATGDYAYTNMINASATMGLGHITVEADGYNASPSVNKRVTDSKKVRDLALSISAVYQASIRVTGQAMFASAAKSVGGVFIGIDPSQETAKTNIFLRSLIDGALFNTANGRDVIIGSGMASKLQLKLGRKLVYTTTDIHGEMVSEVARVSGIFNTGVSEVDSTIVILPVDRVRNLIAYEPDEATMISVFIHDQRKANDVASTLKTKLSDMPSEILAWHETQPDMAGMISMDRRMNYMSQFLVGILISAGILNTMLMSVMERKREFGIMLAIGMSPWRLFTLVLFESFWLGLVGLILGLIFTAPTYYYMHNVGVDLSNFMGEGYDIAGVLLDPVMKYRLYKESVISIMSAVLGLTTLAGLYPGLRAGQMSPVENLKVI